ncbi:hypothetical protein GCM10009850_068600 [Nonomuraea monospora]|uniref:Uncharacterized protein n=1 Tax=Nonomuraea monospora TaxID=568818 RepID=A0ABN3CQ50_9ACTN
MGAMKRNPEGHPFLSTSPKLLYNGYSCQAEQRSPSESGTCRENGIGGRVAVEGFEEANARRDEGGK